jgi:hypothetical protein
VVTDWSALRSAESRRISRIVQRASDAAQIPAWTLEARAQLAHSQIDTKLTYGTPNHGPDRGARGYVTCVWRRVILSHEENVPDMDPVEKKSVRYKQDWLDHLRRMKDTRSKNKFWCLH